MSFGYSVGDFITIGQLAGQVYKSCKDAPRSFKNISDEAMSMHAVLKEAEESFSGCSFSQSQQARLVTIIRGCRNVLQDIQSLVDKYESLGTQTKRTWDRMRWHSNDIAELRDRLVSNTNLLSAFLLTSQVVVERQLNKFVKECQDGKREPSVLTTQTFESLSIDEKQTWRSIRKELEDIGISVEAFSANKDFILLWFKAALTTGAFEEQSVKTGNSFQDSEYSPAGQHINQGYPQLEIGSDEWVSRHHDKLPTVQPSLATDAPEPRQNLEDTRRDEQQASLLPLTSNPEPESRETEEEVLHLFDKIVLDNASPAPRNGPSEPRNASGYKDLLLRAEFHSSEETTCGNRSAMSQPSRAPAEEQSNVSTEPIYEPSLSCAICAKPHMEYELHYNCSKCGHGNWNICLSCYRAGRGCSYWFGFGNAAWAKWERFNSTAEAPIKQPHILTAKRYIPPKAVPQRVDGRHTITSEDPRKWLQSGSFCANCLAWANECYWRCEYCNEGDWGFCNDCVNQGKCCTHDLLPLAFQLDQNNTYPLNSIHSQQTLPSANPSTIPGVVESGPWKPLSLEVYCDICCLPIQLSSARYHCFYCTSSAPGSQRGDYDICIKCYYSLEVKEKLISCENGHRGWRRCLKGHRMIVVGFKVVGGVQRRTIVQNLIGGLELCEKPLKSDQAEQGLQQWSWKCGTQVCLVTKDVSATTLRKSVDFSLTTKFPPSGGCGVRVVANWSWYPREGERDELLFPKGAEVRECVDINADWYWGVYMGAVGLFPAPYVEILDEGPVSASVEDRHQNNTKVPSQYQSIPTFGK